MKKILSEKLPLVHPVTIAILASRDEKKINFTTIGDIAVAGMNPPLVMISLHKNHLATTNINGNKPFSVNVATVEMIKQVDYAGCVSGNDKPKENLFKWEIIENIPIVSNSPVSLLLKERERVEVEKRVIIICDVLKTIVEKHLVKEGTIDLKDVKSLLYGLDNNYYSCGKVVGEGYCEYKKINQ